jgi:hypothetical protein
LVGHEVGHQTRDALALNLEGLEGATAILGLLTTPKNGLAQLGHLPPPSLALALGQICVKTLVNLEFSTPNTDTTQDILDRWKELNVVHRARQTEMTEMSGTAMISLATG